MSNAAKLELIVETQGASPQIRDITGYQHGVFTSDPLPSVEKIYDLYLNIYALDGRTNNYILVEKTRKVTIQNTDSPKIISTDVHSNSDGSKDIFYQGANIAKFQLYLSNTNPKDDGSVYNSMMNVCSDSTGIINCNFGGSFHVNKEDTPRKYTIKGTNTYGASVYSDDIIVPRKTEYSGSLNLDKDGSAEESSIDSIKKDGRAFCDEYIYDNWDKNGSSRYYSCPSNITKVCLDVYDTTACNFPNKWQSPGGCYAWGRVREARCYNNVDPD